MTTCPWNICVISLLEVVGHDGEMADMSNPRGEIIRPVCYLQADHKDGHRFHGPCLGQGEPYDFDAALFFVQREMYPDWSPTGREDWHEVQPCYGSPAYEAAQPFIVAEERARELAPF